ncbi:hypothetical protein Tco_0016905 [Tanacetum coccineum]
MMRDEEGEGGICEWMIEGRGDAEGMEDLDEGGGGGGLGWGRGDEGRMMILGGRGEGRDRLGGFDRGGCGFGDELEGDEGGRDIVADGRWRDMGWGILDDGTEIEDEGWIERRDCLRGRFGWEGGDGMGNGWGNGRDDRWPDWGMERGDGWMEMDWKRDGGLRRSMGGWVMGDGADILGGMMTGMGRGMIRYLSEMWDEIGMR